ncbi:hypothetical protein HPB49_001145 [Dermacentor silvarum]|uniref:Uncharacterized protein n=1 Tax=Dermacentor silvarum TaxID=543639 RepID=A0ACB8D1P0_DERSI|nr:hypothetical protein HPB49_001145 [Dermacentor silvarum]
MWKQLARCDALSLKYSIRPDSCRSQFFPLRKGSFSIPLRGCLFTEVTFKGRTAYLLFYVVPKGTSIPGIDAIKALDLHIEGSSLHCFETSTMTATFDAAQLSGPRQVSPRKPLPKTLSS